MPLPPRGPVPTRNQLADEFGRLQRDLLSHETADRDPEQIGLGQA